MNTTKTAQFTPGPWGLDAMQVDGYIPVRGGVGEVVALANMSEANAALIAAAPAMYEALQATLAYFLRSKQTHAPEVQTIRQAITQAEGR